MHRFHVETFTGKQFFAGSFDGSVAYAGVYELEDSELRKHLRIDDGIAKDIFDSDYRLPQKSIANYGPTYALLIFILLMCLPLKWVFRGDADVDMRVE